ncbi:hypothetical protein [Amaricoccus sp.]|uniref:hypothetical protein n=1 Tax=Amaricoccus sp. TaxID=1872485 RepID=UPI002608CB21|nr:hypothetical protein [Amaricoccus sp.]HRO13046.1 hypothetical protein [Amaricoccus sp.]
MAEQFLLEVAGAPVGSLRSFRGLDVEAEIATRDLGPRSTPKKHVAAVRWTPAVATFGGGMGEGMQGWIAEALDRGAATRGGSVAVAGPGGAPAFSVGFSGARLAAVSFPALDAAAKEPAEMSVEFVARQVEWDQGGAAAAGPGAGAGAAWQRSSFRVEIGDLPCQRVIAVDGFTWTCAADGAITVPDVRLVVSRADLAPWEEAARRWFIDRDYRDRHEMNGTISLLAADGKSELARIELGHVGLKRFSHDEVGENGFAVVLYVERLGFKVA